MNHVAFYEAKLHYEIDSYDLAELIKHDHSKVVIVDTRSKEAYAQEHLPSAINIPHRTMSDQTTRDLDNALTYITYCDGIGCNASTKGAYNLTKLGFTCKELIGGLEWWKRDGYPTEGENAATGRAGACGCTPALPEVKN